MQSKAELTQKDIVVTKPEFVYLFHLKCPFFTLYKIIKVMKKIKLNQTPEANSIMKIAVMDLFLNLIFLRKQDKNCIFEKI